MADYKVTDTELTSIANAIRTKGGTQAQLEFPNGFVSAVQAIPTGGGGVVQPLSVTQNGTYNPPSGVDGYAPVTVNVSGGGTGRFSELDLLDYIESDGNQWIDTGYKVKNNTKIIIVANINTSGNQYSTMFGARNGTDGTGDSAGLWMMTRLNNTNRMMYSWATYEAEILSTNNALSVYGYKTRFEIKKQRVCVINDNDFIKAIEFNGGVVSDAVSLYLFTLNQRGADYGAGAHCIMKLYGFDVYEDDTLVMSLRPVLDGSNVACMYDSVSQTYLYNSGSGVFTYGADT